MHLDDVVRLIDIGELLFGRQGLIQKLAKFLEAVILELEVQNFIFGYHAADVGVVVEIGLAELVAVLNVTACPDPHNEIQDFPVRINTLL